MSKHLDTTQIFADLKSSVFLNRSKKKLVVQSALNRSPYSLKSNFFRRKNLGKIKINKKLKKGPNLMKLIIGLDT